MSSVRIMLTPISIAEHIRLLLMEVQNFTNEKKQQNFTAWGFLFVMTDFHFEEAIRNYLLISSKEKKIVRKLQWYLDIIFYHIITVR